jgi:hypothetical protein
VSADGALAAAAGLQIDPVAATGRIRWRWTGPIPVSLGVSIAGLLWYVVTVPHAPDLAAQVARSGVARGAGIADWWVGWFGGLQLPSYSVLAPSLVAAVGVPAAAAISVVVAVVAMADALRATARPVLGSVAFAVFSVLDVAAGRLTFSLGVAAAAVSVAALRRRRVSAVAAALACALFSLLAAFFLGVAAVAVVLTDSTRRRLAVGVAAVLLAIAVGAQLLFPETGTMPYRVVDILGASATALGVAWLVPLRPVRVGALLMTVIPLATMAVPGALGVNVVRLSWMVATPLLLAAGRVRRLPVLLAAGAAVAVWPVWNTVGQLATAQDASAHRAFYQPLIRQLQAQSARSGTPAIGQRVEVVPTRSHWETNYLTDQFQVARGWDRQADFADNPLFYRGPLTAARYRTWLRQMAVGWVARPHAPLDGAGVAEARIVDTQPAYLKPVWRSPEWDLYQVVPTAHLALGADVVRVEATRLTLRFHHAGSAEVKVRWVPYLAATPTSDPSARGCAQADGEFTTVTVTAAGDYVLGSDFPLVANGCL